MSFIGIVIAVVVGLFLYKLLGDTSYEFKINKEYKQLLQWEKEYEHNILVGKDVEKNKENLERIQQKIREFRKDYINKK
jgi:predicted Holliday junction resolvase-like endonuclease